MNELFALEIGRNALMMIVMLSAPMMAAALVVGLLISVFQALTQINEQTMTFVPKILAVFAALVVTGPWLLNSLVNYTASMFTMLPSMVR
jgi:flagellar biosynthetic protein FliQ